MNNCYVVDLNSLDKKLKETIIEMLKQTGRVPEKFKVCREVNICSPWDPEFYYIEDLETGERFGTDYYEHSWDTYDVLYYNWTKEEVVREVDDTIPEKIYYILEIYNKEYTIRDILEEFRDEFEEELTKKLIEWLKDIEYYDIFEERYKKIGDVEIKDGLVINLEDDYIIIDLSFLSLYKGNKIYNLWDADNEQPIIKEDTIYIYGLPVDIKVKIISREGYCME